LTVLPILDWVLAVSVSPSDDLLLLLPPLSGVGLTGMAVVSAAVVVVSATVVVVEAALVVVKAAVVVVVEDDVVVVEGIVLVEVEDVAVVTAAISTVDNIQTLHVCNI